MLAMSWTKSSSHQDLTKAPEQGHLPHSCRIPRISHHHQLSKVQTPNSWLQSLPGWAELQPGLLQKLGAWSKTVQENASKKMSRTAPNFSFSCLQQYVLKDMSAVRCDVALSVWHHVVISLCVLQVLQHCSSLR